MRLKGERGQGERTDGIVGGATLKMVSNDTRGCKGSSTVSLGFSDETIVADGKGGGR